MSMISERISMGFRESLVDELGDLLVEGEGNCDIKHDSGKSGDGSLVEALDTFFFQDLHEAIERTLVLVSV